MRTNYIDRAISCLLLRFASIYAARFRGSYGRGALYRALYRRQASLAGEEPVVDVIHRDSFPIHLARLPGSTLGINLLLVGEWEGAMCRSLVAHLRGLGKPNPIYVDIGTNIGIHALTIAKYVGGSRCFAFECNQSALSLLRRNVEMNRDEFEKSGSEFTVIDKAFAAEPAVLQFHQVIGDDGHGSLNPSTHRDGVKAEIVKVDAVNEQYLLEVLKLDMIDVIKIDVEGAERDIVKGLKRILEAKRIGRIYIEIWKGPDDDGEKLVAELENYGYRMLSGSIGQLRNMKPGHPIDFVFSSSGK